MRVTHQSSASPQRRDAMAEKARASNFPNVVFPFEYLTSSVSLCLKCFTLSVCFRIFFIVLSVLAVWLLVYQNYLRSQRLSSLQLEEFEQLQNIKYHIWKEERKRGGLDKAFDVAFGSDKIDEDVRKMGADNALLNSNDAEQVLQNYLNENDEEYESELLTDEANDNQETPDGYDDYDDDDDKAMMAKDEDTMDHDSKIYFEDSSEENGEDSEEIDYHKEKIDANIKESDDNIDEIYKNIEVVDDNIEEKNVEMEENDGSNKVDDDDIARNYEKIDSVDENIADKKEETNGNIGKDEGNIGGRNDNVEEKNVNTEDKHGYIEQTNFNMEENNANSKEKNGKIEEKVGNIEEKVGYIKEDNSKTGTTDREPVDDTKLAENKEGDIKKDGGPKIHVTVPVESLNVLAEFNDTTGGIDGTNELRKAGYHKSQNFNELVPITHGAPDVGLTPVEDASAPVSDEHVQATKNVNDPSLERVGKVEYSKDFSTVIHRSIEVHVDNKGNKTRDSYYSNDKLDPVHQITADEKDDNGLKRRDDDDNSSSSNHMESGFRDTRFGVNNINDSGSKMGEIVSDSVEKTIHDTVQNNAPTPEDMKGPYSLLKRSELERIVHETAVNNTVIISVLDYAYLEMALNLVTTSFRPHGITNYIFICLSKEAQVGLEKFGVPCLLHEVDTETDKPSVFGSKAFIAKTLIKPLYVLEALKLNYDVMLVDLDIVFFKNPLKHINCDVEQYDLCIQLDTATKDKINSGFYLVHPTIPGIDIHQKIMFMLGNDPTTRVQKVMLYLFSEMDRKREIRTKLLDIYKYPPGKVYFELGQRMFQGENPCTDCVIVHSNWIRYKEAKVYRMKETGLWSVDTNGYYSDPHRKYLMYSNPLNVGNLTDSMERNALQVALLFGKLLNRTIILPTFCCKGCDKTICGKDREHCSMNVQFHMRDFDKYFSGKYRESQFLEHHMVPMSVKQSVSPLLRVNTTAIWNRLAFRFNLSLDTIESQLMANDAKLFTPLNPRVGSGSREILQWFKESKLNDYAILKFHSLYFALTSIWEEHRDIDFEKMLAEGLTGADYRQNTIIGKFVNLNGTPDKFNNWE